MLNVKGAEVILHVQISQGAAPRPAKSVATYIMAFLMQIYSYFDLV